MNQYIAETASFRNEPFFKGSSQLFVGCFSTSATFSFILALLATDEHRFSQMFIFEVINATEITEFTEEIYRNTCLHIAPLDSPLCALCVLCGFFFLYFFNHERHETDEIEMTILFASSRLCVRETVPCIDIKHPLRTIGMALLSLALVCTQYIQRRTQIIMPVRCGDRNSQRIDVFQVGDHHATPFL